VAERIGLLDLVEELDCTPASSVEEMPGDHGSDGEVERIPFRRDLHHDRSVHQRPPQRSRGANRGSDHLSHQPQPSVDVHGGFW